MLGNVEGVRINNEIMRLGITGNRQQQRTLQQRRHRRRR